MKTLVTKKQIVVLALPIFTTLGAWADADPKKQIEGCDASATQEADYTIYVASENEDHKDLERIIQALPKENGKQFEIVNTPEGRPSIRLRRPELRKVEYPQWISKGLVYQPENQGLRQDARSAFKDLTEIDARTVQAADTGYDIRERVLPNLQSHLFMGESVSFVELLKNYNPVKFYGDPYSGLKGVALESKKDEKIKHRIYAVAGSQVFTDRDLRDWASGMTLSRLQFVSNSAMEMIEDAGKFATSKDGGEVFYTGQSQGGLLVQGLGFLTQSYIDVKRASAPRKNLIHVVSWGATGGMEPIMTMINLYRTGSNRGFNSRLEKHWLMADPEQEHRMSVWQAIAEKWTHLKEDEIEKHIESKVKMMRVVGYFFDVDFLARAGKFIGQTFVFDRSFAYPDRCSLLVSEQMLGQGRLASGGIGAALEGHFLEGYKRAVKNHGLNLVKAALPGKWPWTKKVQKDFDFLGRIWADDLYFSKMGKSPDNWKKCFDSKGWSTNLNMNCTEYYHPGCAPLHEYVRESQSRPSSADPLYCLIK